MYCSNKLTLFSVVGGGGNKFTELRRNLKRNAKASSVTVGVLSTVEMRGFYIRIKDSKDLIQLNNSSHQTQSTSVAMSKHDITSCFFLLDLIEFGREGAELPIIKYYDIDPLEIKYFSFAAWNGVEAKFLYDCPIPGEG